MKNKLNPFYRIQSCIHIYFVLRARGTFDDPAMMVSLMSRGESAEEPQGAGLRSRPAAPSRLDCAALPASEILQLAPGDVEGLVNSDRRVLSRGIRFGALHRRLGLDVFCGGMHAAVVRDDDLAARDGQVDAHVEMVAALMMPLSELDEHATAHEWLIEALELRDARSDVRLERVGPANATESDVGSHV